MKKISSKLTFLHKKILPVFVFVILSIGSILIFSASGPKSPPVFVAVFPIIIGVFLFFIFKKLIFVLADEVFDCGDYLLVKKDGVEENVYLNNIRNVSYAFSKPPFIHLSLRTPGRLGRDIFFSPPTPAWNFAFFHHHPLAEELIDRIDAMKILRKD
jgi:hypothetical protein